MPSSFTAAPSSVLACISASLAFSATAEASAAAALSRSSTTPSAMARSASGSTIRDRRPITPSASWYWRASSVRASPVISLPSGRVRDAFSIASFSR
ncbi:hypothetical protein D3C86_1492750 [compost metagenome]